MRQKSHRALANLIGAGSDLEAGAVAHAANLGLVVGTVQLVTADLDGLILAADQYRSAVSALRTARNALAIRIKAASDVAFTLRDTLKRALGRTYSSRWEGTGFNRSLRVPRSATELKHLLRCLQGYFTNHPELQVTGVATATIADSVLQALTSAHSTVTVQKGAVRSFLAARRKKERAMRLRIRGVVEELRRVIGEVDGRWEAFGLNQPGLKQAPPAPEEITVETFDDNTKSVKWKKTPRADHYRVWLKVEGVDEEARPVGTPSDPDFTLENLPPGASFELSLSAVNNGGESPRSLVVVGTSTL